MPEPSGSFFGPLATVSLAISTRDGSDRESGIAGQLNVSGGCTDLLWNRIHAHRRCGSCQRTDARIGGVAVRTE